VSAPLRAGRRQQTAVDLPATALHEAVSLGELPHHVEGDAPAKPKPRVDLCESPEGSTSAVQRHLARLGITARETEILRLVNAGLSNADISHHCSYRSES
jgi:hypothetical protein